MFQIEDLYGKVCKNNFNAMDIKTPTWRISGLIINIIIYNIMNYIITTEWSVYWKNYEKISQLKYIL